MASKRAITGISNKKGKKRKFKHSHRGLSARRINPNAILDKLETATFFGLDQTEKNWVKSAMEAKVVDNLSFFIHPKFLRKLRPGVSQHLVLIDSRRNDVYKEVKRYLEDSASRITAFYTCGYADFLCLFYGTDTEFEAFRDKTIEILKHGPLTDKRALALFTSFKVVRPHIVRQNLVKDNELRDQDVLSDSSFLASLEELHRGYMYPRAIKRIGSLGKVRKFLNDLSARGIMIGHYPLYQFAPYKIRVYTTLSYCEPRSFEVIMRSDALRRNILDVLEVNYEPVPGADMDEFDQSTRYVILGDYSTLHDYHTWNTKVLEAVGDKDLRISLFSFPLEGTLVERPYDISDFPSFKDSCKEYTHTPTASIKVGHALFRDEKEPRNDLPISFSLYGLENQGMILGGQGSGKTWTALCMAKQMFDRNIAIHVLDFQDGMKRHLVRPDKVDQDWVNKNVQYLDATLLERTAGRRQEIRNRGFLCYHIANPREYLETFLSIKRFIEARQQSDLPHETKNGIRSVDTVVFLEEAFQLFSRPHSMSELLGLYKFAARKGFSIWVSTQKISDFVGEQGAAIIKELGNAIVQRVSDDEARRTIDTLGLDVDCRYYDISKQISKLSLGEAFVKFQLRKNGEFRTLPVMKVKIIGKLEET